MDTATLRIYGSNDTIAARLQYEQTADNVQIRHTRQEGLDVVLQTPSRPLFVARTFGVSLGGWGGGGKGSFTPFNNTVFLSTPTAVGLQKRFVFALYLRVAPLYLFFVEPLVVDRSPIRPHLSLSSRSPVVAERREMRVSRRFRQKSRVILPATRLIVAGRSVGGGRAGAAGRGVNVEKCCKNRVALVCLRCLHLIVPQAGYGGGGISSIGVILDAVEHVG